MRILFDGMRADIKAKKKISPTVGKLSLIVLKLNISLAFISQYCFKLAKLED